MKYRRLNICIQTTDGPYGIKLDFPDGLVVLWADNSMGKSTCVKSILIALGMEAMLTPTQADLPLPPAVKSRLDSGNGEYDVLESEVFLEIENLEGDRIVLQRTIKGTRDKNLITVHHGPALSSPGAPVTKTDLFVSRQGAATREFGFHHFLAKFLAWDLPLVPTYDGKEYPLYLQCIFPYFIVEQTRGWSTVQPPLPSHFRIRDPHKRVTEFLLDLDAHRVALKRQEILFEKTRIESEWTTQIDRVSQVAQRISGLIQGLPKRPVASWPPQISPILVVPIGNEWVPIQDRVKHLQKTLDQLTFEEVPRVRDVAASAQSELHEAEGKIRDRQILLSRLLDSLAMEQEEVKRIQDRLEVIKEDVQKSKDVRTLQHLGSRQDSPIDKGICPVCHQVIQDSLMPLPEQDVMSLDENINFLTEQQRTYEIVLANARNVLDARNVQVRAIREELSSIRERVRVLQGTLISDERLPSLESIQARIELENAIKTNHESQDQFESIMEGFHVLSQRWQKVQEEMQNLPPNDVTDSDKTKVRAWTRSLRDQLTQYGFASFQVHEVVISPDTYRPEHQGFDIESSFSFQSSISASDLIRTIWSYLHGLLELSRTQKTNHPGSIIFDEPKQQSTRDVSFGELLRRAAQAHQFGQQVIFFTSENQERLKSHLLGLQHTFTQVNGRLFKKIKKL